MAKHRTIATNGGDWSPFGCKVTAVKLTKRPVQIRVLGGVAGAPPRTEGPNADAARMLLVLTGGGAIVAQIDDMVADSDLADQTHGIILALVEVDREAAPG